MGLLKKSLVRPVKTAVAQKIVNNVPRPKAKPVAKPMNQTKGKPGAPAGMNARMVASKRGYKSAGC